MQEPSATLPFKVPGLFGGLAEVRGLAKASPAALVLEFYTKETMLNLLKGDIKELVIPHGEIDSIRHERGWFGDRVRVRVKTMKLLSDFPASEGGELELRTARRDRNQAADLVQILGKP